MAEVTAVVFSSDDAQRIGRTVQTVEKANPTFANVPRGPGPIGRDGQFYAVLTARSGHKYSWTKLEAQDDDDPLALAENEDWGTGNCEAESGYAVDVFKSENVPLQSVVWLRPAPGRDWYLLELVTTAWRGVISSEVSARVDSLDGHGMVGINLYPANDDSSVGTGVDTVKCFNSTGGIVAAGKQVQCKWIAGRVYVDVEDCS